jgi:hypothetical protein
MQVTRPSATPADYLAIGISPVLIMLLVGSLCFFLIEVFFHGATVGSVRWVMFWFVLAVVLVSRIGIEQGIGHAMVYGLGLAAATWLYLVRIHPAFILGAILLGIVWWCAHKLVWDCTLIDENEDASGSGLLQSVGDKKNFALFEKKPQLKPDKKIKRPKKSAAPHPPGLWVIYFSLAALPLFGIGQMLLPAENLSARHAGFTYLFIYMAAAFGLLLTTSFLGLRRYLRQRYVQMPASIAFSWVRFGAGVAVFILLAALLLPRPGAGDAWQTLRGEVDYKLHQASDYAMRFSPHGKGKGRSGNQSQTDSQKTPPANSQSENQTEPGKSPSPDQQGSRQNQNSPKQPPHSPSAPNVSPLYHLFKILFLLVLTLLICWWIFRQRNLILSAAKSVLESVAQFFRNLFGFRFATKSVTATKDSSRQIHQPFAAFQNPFLSDKENSWSQAQLILYSYDALRAWAEERGIEPRPEQTAREFCAELADRFPEINLELNRLSFFYGRTAYGMSALANQNLEPVKKLWRYFAGDFSAS